MQLLALDESIEVAVAVRRASQIWPERVSQHVTGEIDAFTDGSFALKGRSAVIYCAGRARILSDKAVNPLREFRRVNLEGTLALARQSAAAGVRRFIFISSIGANGAETLSQPFTGLDVVAPHSPYAVSKYEAELGLQALAAESGMEVVIIRPRLSTGQVHQVILVH